MRSPWIPCSLAALVTLATPALRAQNGPQTEQTQRPSGVVVRLEAGRLIVAMEHPASVVVGARMGLFRPLTVRHPVTHRTLTDRIPLGVVVIEHVGAELTTARASGDLADTPRAGDVVASTDDASLPPTIYEAPAAPPREPPRETPPRVTPPAAPPLPPLSALPPPPGTAPPRVTAPTPPTPPPQQQPSQPPAAPAVSSEERQLSDALIVGLGRTPEERAMLYQRYLLQHRDSPYAPSLRTEISALRQFAWAMQQVSSSGATQRPTGPRLMTEATLPDSLREGDPCVIAIQLDPAGGLGEGALFVRREGSPTYERVAMRAEGDAYLRATIPQSFVVAGTIEYFIEVSRSDGQTVALVGRADRPRSVEVLAPPEGPPPPEGRSRVDLRGEVADVGTRTVAGVQRVQRFVTVEGDFLQRLESRWLYGYRVGFGVYDGDALSLSALATPNPSVHTRVIYGYHELEFAFSDFVHLIARLQVGVFREGMVFGTQARLRIGNERRTNVLLGGDVLGEVGQRAFFALNFAPVEQVPMMAQGEVFNQSVAAGDPMFRFIAQVGWRIARWVTVSARGSYQLRNIENGGFGGGLSTTFDW